jgi:hypothetical protein
MGKRSSGFERRERDYYQTPHAAVLPLLAHLPHGAMFIEPCAGDGRLVRHLEQHGMSCTDMFDIEPQHPDVRALDALGAAAWSSLVDPSADFIVTNPPWRRGLLHPMIETFRQVKPDMAAARRQLVVHPAGGAVPALHSQDCGCGTGQMDRGHKHDRQG